MQPLAIGVLMRSLRLIPTSFIFIIFIVLPVGLLYQQQLNIMDKLPSWTPTRQYFVYHALHKTGSQDTRLNIYAHCAKHRYRCLTNGFCQKNSHEMMICNHRESWYSRQGMAIDYGSFTVSRMNACCPIMNMNVDLHGIVDHFSLADPGNRRLLETYFPGRKAYRFTIIRNPLAQFISYYYYLKRSLPITDLLEKKKYRNSSTSRLPDRMYKLPKLTTLIKAFYEMSRFELEVSARKRILYEMMTNSQSKELGWNGNQSTDEHNKVLQYLEQLDSVGLTERLWASWKMFEHGLGWTRRFRMKKEKRSQHNTTSDDILDSLSDKTHEMLRHIQKWDLRLYYRAIELFEKQCQELLATEDCDVQAELKQSV